AAQAAALRPVIQRSKESVSIGRAKWKPCMRPHGRDGRVRSLKIDTGDNNLENHRMRLAP
ncbi:hypothetical protein, partial [Mangrovicoccus sp. HB161399]|uniref:hypothetical protein n=1 Tax=Mangrovicoccus sp. HB161399 TaxID=2720392 RepID=UPI001C131577